MYQELPKNVGDRVKKFRKEKEWTLDQLGRETGLHPSTISQIERGKRNLTLNNLQKVAKGLEVELYQLFLFPDGELVSAEEIDINQVQQLLENVPEQKRELMYQVARTLLNWQPESG
jgi:transcriptional regulator with XRE-family HTH domain